MNLINSQLHNNPRVALASGSVILSFKDIRYNISVLKCVKTTQHLFYLLLSCVLTLYQMFPAMFKSEKSTSFLKVNRESEDDISSKHCLS